MTRPTDLKQNSDLAQPDQLIMMPIVEFSKYNINILHVVKFRFKNVKSCKCKHDMHEKYAYEQQNKTLWTEHCKSELTGTSLDYYKRVIFSSRPTEINF